MSRFAEGRSKQIRDDAALAKRIAEDSDDEPVPRLAHEDESDGEEGAELSSDEEPEEHKESSTAPPKPWWKWERTADKPEAPRRAAPDPPTPGKPEGILRPSNRQLKRQLAALRKEISEKPKVSFSDGPTQPRRTGVTAATLPGTSSSSGAAQAPPGNTALEGGVWQTDGSRHTLDGRLMGRDTSQGTVRLAARNGFPTMRVAYFFSGTERKASIANHLKEMCEAEGFGLELHEVDTLVGGENHDLLKPEVQADWIRRIEDGEFDLLNTGHF